MTLKTSNKQINTETDATQGVLPKQKLLIDHRIAKKKILEKAYTFTQESSPKLLFYFYKTRNLNFVKCSSKNMVVMEIVDLRESHQIWRTWCFSSYMLEVTSLSQPSPSTFSVNWHILGYLSLSHPSAFRNKLNQSNPSVSSITYSSFIS